MFNALECYVKVDTLYRVLLREKLVGEVQRWVERGVERWGEKGVEIWGERRREEKVEMFNALECYVKVDTLYRVLLREKLVGEVER